MGTALEELADRVEAATGPDREIDQAIGFELGTQRWSGPIHPHSSPHGIYDGPHFTASLDSAMSLVPQGLAWGCGWDLETEDKDESGWAWCEEPGELPDNYLRTAVTPALALCAAALRARSTEGGDNG